MAKEDLFEEGKQPAAEKPAVNADKLKALRAAMDKKEKKRVLNQPLTRIS